MVDKNELMRTIADWEHARQSLFEKWTPRWALLLLVVVLIVIVIVLGNKLAHTSCPSCGESMTPNVGDFTMGNVKDGFMGGTKTAIETFGYVKQHQDLQREFMQKGRSYGSPGRSAGSEESQVQTAISPEDDLADF